MQYGQNPTACESTRESKSSWNHKTSSIIMCEGALAAGRYQQFLCEATHAARCTIGETNARFGFKFNFSDKISEIFIKNLIFEEKSKIRLFQRVGKIQN